MPALNKRRTASRKAPEKPAASESRPVAAGDIGPTGNASAIEEHAVAENIASATQAEVSALQDILAGRSPIDARTLTKAVQEEQQEHADHPEWAADDELSDDWKNGGEPEKKQVTRKSNEGEE